VSFALPACPSDQSKYYDNCFGTYTFPGGDKYVGEFRANKRNGQGTLTYADGRTNEGIWNGGVYLGTEEAVEAKRRRQKAQAEAKRRRQEAEELKEKIIFDNCIIDLLPTDPSDPVLMAVMDKCTRISKDPTTLQKWKYSD
jgi:hypothetical protein